MKTSSLVWIDSNPNKIILALTLDTENSEVQYDMYMKLILKKINDLYFPQNKGEIKVNLSTCYQ